MLDKLIDSQIALTRQTQKLLRQESYRPLTEPFLGLPGLVGFWPMSSVQRSTGNAYDLSGQGRTLTYNGNPTYNIYNNLAPYIDLDGTGDYLSRADETDLDILGTETIYASGVRGLTMGGWFYPNSVSGTKAFLGKSGGGGNDSYLLYGNDTATVFVIESTVTSQSLTFSSILTAGAWHFITGKFIASDSMYIFVNNKNTSTTTALTAIRNSTAQFQIGARNLGGSELYLPGRASLCFLCANALPDSLIQYLFESTRWAFGV